MKVIAGRPSSLCCWPGVYYYTAAAGQETKQGRTVCIFIYVAGHPPSKCNLLRIDAMTETIFFSFSSRQNFVRLCFLGTARVFVATFCDGHPALLLLAPRRQLLPPIDFEVAPTTTPIDPPPLTGAAAAAVGRWYHIVWFFYFIQISRRDQIANRWALGQTARPCRSSITRKRRLHSKV